MEKQVVYVLISSVEGMRFIHGVRSTEAGAKQWVEQSSKAFRSSGADYFYRDLKLDDPNA